MHAGCLVPRLAHVLGVAAAEAPHLAAIDLEHAVRERAEEVPVGTPDQLGRNAPRDVNDGESTLCVGKQGQR